MARRKVASDTHASVGVGYRSDFRALILCDETLRENMLFVFDATVDQMELLFLSLMDFVLIEDNDVVDGKERRSWIERRCRREAAFPDTGCPLMLGRS
jgi:hypothetical protein